MDKHLSGIFHPDRFSRIPKLSLVRTWLKLGQQIAWTLGPHTLTRDDLDPEEQAEYDEVEELIGPPLDCEECLWEVKTAMLVFIPASISAMPGVFTQVKGLTMRHNYFWGWGGISTINKQHQPSFNICQMLNRTAKFLGAPLPEHPVFISRSIAKNFGQLNWEKATCFSSPIVYRAQLTMVPMDTSQVPSARTNRFDAYKSVPFGIRFSALKYAFRHKVMSREYKIQQDRIAISSK